MKKKRRQIEKQGLKEIKQAFNNGYSLKELDNIDYFKDTKAIKIKSRNGLNVDYIEKQSSGSRLILGYSW
mgnify:FL=1